VFLVEDFRRVLVDWRQNSNTKRRR